MKSVLSDRLAPELSQLLKLLCLFDDSSRHKSRIFALEDVSFGSLKTQRTDLCDGKRFYLSA